MEETVIERFPGSLAYHVFLTSAPRLPRCWLGKTYKESAQDSCAEWSWRSLICEQRDTPENNPDAPFDFIPENCKKMPLQKNTQRAGKAVAPKPRPGFCPKKEWCLPLTSEQGCRDFTGTSNE